MLSISQMIKEAIQHNQFKTQKEIIDWLIKKKIKVNQSSVSRALRKIGALKKLNQNGEIQYKLQNHNDIYSQSNNFGSLIKNISNNENMVVITSQPGSAPLIAEVIDQQKSKLILATLAGENCILVIPHKNDDIIIIKETLLTLFEVNL